MEKIRASWRARALRALFQYARPVTNAAWYFWIWAARKACWIVMPITALAATEAITAGISPTGHGELAIFAAYVIAAISSIQAAYAASNRLRVFARPLW